MRVAMAGGKLYGGANMAVLLQNERLPCSSDVLESLWLHTSDPPSFQGSKSVVDFENGNRGISSNNNRVITEHHRSFFQGLEKEENCCDDDYDSCFNQMGSNSKKRRLTSEQVQFLERNFEIENKLEPERKVQLAKELGLQPRQVAIWFQNRRARFKTKQLEKEYGALKSSYDKLKGDYENLQQQNDKLREEVNSLKNKLIPRDNNNNNKEKEKSSSCGADATTTIAVNSPQKDEAEEPLMDLISISNTNSDDDGSNKLPLPIMVTCCKQQHQEDANSAKSDVLDSDSPQYCNDIVNNNINKTKNNIHHHSSSSSFVEPADDSSQDDEDDNLSTENLLTLPCLPKVEEEEDACYPDKYTTCGFGFPVEDQAFCFWPY